MAQLDGPHRLICYPILLEGRETRSTMQKLREACMHSFDTDAKIASHNYGDGTRYFLLIEPAPEHGKLVKFIQAITDL